MYLTSIVIGGQYFGRVEQNLSCRKLGYILSTFHRRVEEVFYERKVQR